MRKKLKTPINCRKRAHPGLHAGLSRRRSSAVGGDPRRSGAEERQNCENAAVGVWGVVQAKFREDAADVSLDRFWAYHHGFGDAEVRSALSDEGEYFALTLTELVERAGPARAPDKSRDDRRVDHTLAFGDSGNRVRQHCDI